MKVTKENYECLIIDYLDGRLNAHAQAALLLFLSAHPEIDADFELLALPDRLPHAAEPGRFDHLRIDGAFATKDEWLAAVAEGDVRGSAADAARSDATDGAAIAQFAKLRLTPDPMIIFQGKEKLYRAAVVPLYRTLLFRSAAAAAAVLLLVGAALMWLQEAPSAQRASTHDMRLNTAAVKPIGQPATPAITPVPDAPEATLGQVTVAQTKNTPAAPTDLRERHPAMAVLKPRHEGRVPHALPERSLYAGELRDLGALLAASAREGEKEPETDHREGPKEEEAATQNLREFLASRAVERLTGRTPDAATPYGRILTERAFEKVDELSDGQIAFKPNVTDRRRSFYLKLGPLAVER